MVVGNLGGDPQLRHLPTGQPLVGVSIATDESFTDKAGQKRERVEWYNIVAFGKLAQACNEFLNKGRQVFVEGRLRTGSSQGWSDNSFRTADGTTISPNST
jgi:single-strand DNA-binding protein